MKKDERKTKKRLLQVRLDDEHGFALDFLCAQLGVKFTRVVERAIISGASEEAQKLGIPWANLWDEDEGVRKLTLWSLHGYNGTTEEKALRNFAVHHAAFFYADSEKHVPHRTFVLHLWPDIERYYRLWLDKRHEDHWVAAHAMASALKAKKVRPPKYGDE